MTAIKTTIRKQRIIPPSEDFREIQAPVFEPSPVEESEMKTTQGLDDFSKLDLFALVASSAVARRVDDPAQIAHESFAIAKQMLRLSELYKQS